MFHHFRVDWDLAFAKHMPTVISVERISRCTTTLFSGSLLNINHCITYKYTFASTNNPNIHVANLTVLLYDLAFLYLDRALSWISITWKTKELGTVSMAHRPCPIAKIEVPISSNFFVGINCSIPLVYKMAFVFENAHAYNKYRIQNRSNYPDFPKIRYIFYV
jgi:hypothetical protein